MRSNNHWAFRGACTVLMYGSIVGGMLLNIPVCAVDKEGQSSGEGLVEAIGKKLTAAQVLAQLRVMGDPGESVTKVQAHRDLVGVLASSEKIDELMKLYEKGAAAGVRHVQAAVDLFEKQFSGDRVIGTVVTDVKKLLSGSAPAAANVKEALMTMSSKIQEKISAPAVSPVTMPVAQTIEQAGVLASVQPKPPVTPVVTKNADVQPKAKNISDVMPVSANGELKASAAAPVPVQVSPQAQSAPSAPVAVPPTPMMTGATAVTPPVVPADMSVQQSPVMPIPSAPVAMPQPQPQSMPVQSMQVSMPPQQQPQSTPVQSTQVAMSLQSSPSMMGQASPGIMPPQPSPGMPSQMPPVIASAQPLPTAPASYTAPTAIGQTITTTGATTPAADAIQSLKTAMTADLSKNFFADISDPRTSVARQTKNKKMIDQAQNIIPWIIKMLRQVQQIKKGYNVADGSNEATLLQDLYQKIIAFTFYAQLKSQADDAKAKLPIDDIDDATESKQITNLLGALDAVNDALVYARNQDISSIDDQIKVLQDKQSEMITLLSSSEPLSSTAVPHKSTADAATKDAKKQPTTSATKLTTAMPAKPTTKLTTTVTAKPTTRLAVKSAKTIKQKTLKSKPTTVDPTDKTMPVDDATVTPAAVTDKTTSVDATTPIASTTK